MPVFYPYTLTNLSGAGRVPVDGVVVEAIHFNRIFREITNLEGVIGKDIEGDKSSLKDRLAVHMLNSGYWEREWLAERDLSGNDRGSGRWVDCWQKEYQISSPVGLNKIQHRLAYSLWADAPPVLVLAPAFDGGWDKGVSCIRIENLSEIMARIDVRGGDGTRIDTTETFRLMSFACSREVQIYEGDVAWAHRPQRTGS